MSIFATYPERTMLLDGTIGYHYQIRGKVEGEDFLIHDIYSDLPRSEIEITEQPEMIEMARSSLPLI